MSDVLLAHCNHLFYDRKQVRKMQPYPPLQTLYAAAVLRSSGYDVALFDSTLNPPEEGFRRAVEAHGPRLVALCEDNFNFLTKMCLTRNRELAYSMAGIAAERGVPVAVNGSDASDRFAEYLCHGFDYVMSGEVESTLAELVGRCLRQTGPSIDQIAGLIFRDPGTGRLRANAPRPVLADLGRLPKPAWDLVEMDAYRRTWNRAHGYFSLNMIASRGCPYHCNWCAKPIHGQSYHCASPRRVAEEMAHLKESFQPDHLWFADDIFALSLPWTLRFADEVEALSARIPFKMQSRCDLMTPETAAALRRAGCVEVWMGAESGSQRILDAMDKGLDAAQIYRARENLRSNGIRACIFLQFGYPGETWEDIQNTIKMFRETQPDDIGVSVSYPLPGTKFHERVSAQLGEKQNWSDSDDLAMMFRGTYSNDLYHALHDALHLELDLRNGGNSNGAGLKNLEALWSRVEDLRRTGANPKPTPLWTSC